MSPYKIENICTSTLADRGVSASLLCLSLSFALYFYYKYAVERKKASSILNASIK